MALTVGWLLSQVDLRLSLAAAAAQPRDPDLRIVRHSNTTTRTGRAHRRSPRLPGRRYGRSAAPTSPRGLAVTLQEAFR